MNNLKILKNILLKTKNIESVYDDIHHKCKIMLNNFVEEKFDKCDYNQKIFFKSMELGFNVGEIIKNIFINIYFLKTNEDVFLINNMYYKCFMENFFIIDIKNILDKNIENDYIEYDNKKIIFKKKYLDKLISEFYYRNYGYLKGDEILNNFSNDNFLFFFMKKNIDIEKIKKKYKINNNIVFEADAFDEEMLYLLYDSFTKYKNSYKIIKNIFLFDDFKEITNLSHIIHSVNEIELREYISPPFLIFFNNNHDYYFSKQKVAKIMYDYSSFFSFKLPLRNQLFDVKNEYIIPYQVLEIFYPSIKKYKNIILTSEKYDLDFHYFLNNDNRETIIKRYIILQNYSLRFFKNVFDFMLRKDL